MKCKVVRTESGPRLIDSFTGRQVEILIQEEWRDIGYVGCIVRLMIATQPMKKIMFGDTGHEANLKEVFAAMAGNLMDQNDGKVRYGEFKPEKHEIHVKTDFSAYPGCGKSKEDNLDYCMSGTCFRTSLLQPRFEKARKAGQKLTVYLDGVSGYSWDFLAESFGEMAKRYREDFTDNLNLVSADFSKLPKVIRDMMAGYIAGRVPPL